VKESTVASLPRQLVGAISAHVSHRALHLLPQGIDSVVLDYFEKDELNEIQGFPSSLTRISMSSLDERTARRLPSHLKSIETNLTVFTPSILTSMPPKITELISVDTSALKSAEDWKLLGRDLKRLDVAPDRFGRADTGSPISNTCPMSSSWLPNRLVFLALDRLDIQHAEWFSHLPRTLETMRLQVFSIPSDSFQHIQLPNLTELHLTASREDSLRTSAIPLADLLRTLPFSLEEFRFNASGNHGKSQWNYCNEDLMNLPPFLHTLLIPESTTPLTSELLPYLPRTLISFLKLAWFKEHRREKNDEKMALNKQQMLVLASQYGFPTQGITKMFETRM
jgi:hypothetical protein